MNKGRYRTLIRLPRAYGDPPYLYLYGLRLGSSQIVIYSEDETGAGYELTGMWLTRWVDRTRLRYTVALICRDAQDKGWKVNASVTADAIADDVLSGVELNEQEVET